MGKRRTRKHNKGARKTNRRRVAKRARKTRQKGVRGKRTRSIEMRGGNYDFSVEYNNYFTHAFDVTHGVSERTKNLIYLVKLINSQNEDFQNYWDVTDRNEKNNAGKKKNESSILSNVFDFATAIDKLNISQDDKISKIIQLSNKGKYKIVYRDINKIPQVFTIEQLDEVQKSIRDFLNDDSYVPSRLDHNIIIVEGIYD